MEHNRGNFEALLKSIIGSFKSIIGSGLQVAISSKDKQLKWRYHNDATICDSSTKK